MNLYLISQSANGGYDTYDSAVVCAENEADARTIHPCGDSPHYVVPPGKGVTDQRFGTWTSQDNVTVELLGVAEGSVPRGVVLASYNAG